MLTAEDVIATYSRAQALEDGVLVELPGDVTRRVCRWPVAVTASVWADVERADRQGADVAGVLHDLLWMSVHVGQPLDAYRKPFQVIVGGELVELVIAIGEGDRGEPVLTIMRPGED